MGFFLHFSDKNLHLRVNDIVMCIMLKWLVILTYQIVLIEEINMLMNGFNEKKTERFITCIIFLYFVCNL